METINPQEIGGNIDATLLRVISGQQPVLIKGENDRSVVMLSLEEFNRLQETLYLLSNPANAEHLRKSINDLENDRGITITLDDL